MRVTAAYVEEREGVVRYKEEIRQMDRIPGRVPFIIIIIILL